MSSRTFVYLALLILITGCGLNGSSPDQECNGVDSPSFVRLPVDYRIVDGSNVGTDTLTSINPMGVARPPFFITPTGQMEFHGYDSSDSNAPLGVIAPSRLWISAMRYITVQVPGEANIELYELDFQICSNITGTIGQMEFINDELTRRFSGLTACSNPYLKTYGASSSYSIRVCEQSFSNMDDYIKVEPGFEIGDAMNDGGGGNSTFTMELSDDRVTGNYINETVYQDLKHQVCFLDYLLDEDKNNTTGLIGYIDNSSNFIQRENSSNICGTIFQDNSSSGIMGTWVRTDSGKSELQYSISFLEDPYYTSKQAISMGVDNENLQVSGVFMKPEFYQNIDASGTAVNHINVPFSDIAQNDSYAYCYEHNTGTGEDGDTFETEAGTGGILFLTYKTDGTLEVHFTTLFPNCSSVVPGGPWTTTLVLSALGASGTKSTFKRTQ